MTTGSGSDYVVQMQPWLGEEEKKAVVDYLDSGGWLTEFRRTREFEQALAAYIGARHVSVVMNGTVSLFAALAALGVGVGDEVIVPDLTMIASANAVLLTGATPRFVDIDRATLCLDLAEAERRITPRTKAIMLVSFNGRAPDMDRAVALARDRGVLLVEDAAQALGSRWRGKHLGTFGAVGSFSFSSPKVITTGQGGALVTDDDALIAAIRKIKDFGRLRDGVDEHIALGYNFKFTDLQAVIGLAQMTKLDWRVQRKKELFALYRSELASHLTALGYEIERRAGPGSGDAATIPARARDRVAPVLSADPHPGALSRARELSRDRARLAPGSLASVVVLPGRPDSPPHLRRDPRVLPRRPQDVRVKLHLGCGRRYLPGFVHVDLADLPHVDHQSDLRTLPMFKDETADLIYACHVIEYFDRIEVVDVLREWHRVLKHGGVLRLAVPDFDAMTEVYRETRNLALVHGPLYGRIEIPTASGPRVLYHRTVYDFDSLRSTLESAGFRGARRYDWRQTIHKDHDDFSQAYIPHMDKERGVLISLNVEADK